MVFCIKLAGVPIEANVAFESTRDFCREYLTDEVPLLSVELTQEHIQKTRELDKKTALYEGRIPYDLPETSLENLALCQVVTGELLKYGILLFHGAVIAVNGKAYVFMAKSGTGKTTHCRLWLKNVPDCHILNGDKPLLLIKDGKVYACGSPWMGKEHYGVNEILPLEAVCFLERDETNHIEDVALQDGFQQLLSFCHIPSGNGNILKVFNLIKNFSSVKLYHLGCNMEDEAAFVSYNAMVRP